MKGNLKNDTLRCDVIVMIACTLGLTIRSGWSIFYWLLLRSCLTLSHDPKGLLLTIKNWAFSQNETYIVRLVGKKNESI